MITRKEATSRRVECPNGCGLRVYKGNLVRHLTACTRTPEERRAIAFQRMITRRFPR